MVDATLGRLAHRVLMGAFDGATVPDRTRREVERGLGSLCLYGVNLTGTDDVRSRVGDLAAALHDVDSQVLVTLDEEGGDVTRLHYHHGSPHAGAAVLGRVDDLDLTRAVARDLGHDLRGVGVGLDLAPVVDVNSVAENPVIGARSLGADPQLVARHTTAWVEGLQHAGVGACVKHFPGHGATSVDSHLGLPTVDEPREVLDARDLPPFAAAVAAGTVAVMTSHVLLPAVDPHLPATLSAPVLRLLRDDLGFDGLLVTDALDMAGASAGRGIPAAAVLALAAGADLLCLGPAHTGDETDQVVAAVVDAVRAGELAPERLEQAAHRVEAALAQVAALRAAASGDADLAASREAAARAVEVTGTLPRLADALVVRLDAGSNLAVGHVPWGASASGALAAGRVHDLGPDGDLPDGGRGRPVVALVRDAHRHPWVLERLSALAASAPALVVAEMGWPADDLERLVPEGAAVVRTWGAGAASSQALADLLAGAGAA